MANYLTDRSFMVQLNGSRSVKSLIAVGVRHRVDSWSSLFFISMTVFPSTTMVLFADDTTIYFCGDSITSAA